MKDYTLVAVLFVAVCLFISPASAFIWNITGGSGWAVSAYPADAPKMGDGDTFTNWYNAGSGTFSELTWSPTNYYSKLRVMTAGGSDEYWDINGACTLIHTSTWENLSVSPGSAITMRFYAADATCTVDNPWGKIAEIQYENGTPPAPIANFTGSPIAGVAPLTTAFTDTSENEYGTCTYNWSITPSANVTGNVGDLENHNAVFNDVGNYTVSHGVECDGGSNISTKTDYVWVYSPNETETTYFYTYNPLTGYEIHNSNIYLNDIENGSWVNSTDDVDGRLGITALSTHHINAYSDKEGFGDGELLNQLASGLSYPLIMFPSNVTNVSAGNVTLYVNVIDTWAPGSPVEGVLVSITYDWPNIQYATTNDAGVVSFTVPNETVIQIAASKAGYTGVSDSVNSGTGSGGSASVSKTLYITRKTITTAPTATTGPGGETPTPTLTYLPNCDPSASDYDAAKCRTSKGSSGLNLLADNLENLILLCIVVTMFYLLGIRLGR